jgi:hypothetical protein
VKANSLRTQQAIARFGISARYPVCQAALELWRVKDETRKYAKDAESLGELLIKAKQQKRRVRALYERLHKGGKQKEVIEAAAFLREIEEGLLKLQTCYQANVKLFAIWYEQIYPLALARFEREGDAVVRTKDTKAFSALERVKKRWDAVAKGASLKDGDNRKFEILKMLRDKGIKAAEAKDGWQAGYLEVRGADRALSDEFWQGRLTVREIHSRLLRIGGSRLAGDKEGREIGRLLRRLGIRRAEDRRGPKWKPFRGVNKKPKRPPGRSRTKIELEFTGDIGQALSDLFRRSRGKARQASNNQLWDSTEARRTAIEKRLASLKAKREKQRLRSGDPRSPSWRKVLKKP